MNNFIKKLIFLKRKPKVIVIAGKGSKLASEAISQVLRDFLAREQILIFNLTPHQKVWWGAEARKFKFWLKNSSQPILVVTNLGEIPSENFVFASPRSPELENLASQLPSFGYLILNFDDETVRSIGDKLNVNRITFGFGKGADFQIIDLRIGKNGTNFKVDFKGNILPVWLRNIFGKKNIYSALGTLCLGYALNLNLVKLSQNLKSYQGVEGEGQLIEGIKNTFLLDDSKNASPFSMNEMLRILGEIDIGKIYPEPGRRIAVLGDILGIGKYTIEAHEAIGEKAAQNADLLFTVGERAKFIARGAREKGMSPEKIFEFNETSQAGIALQKEMRQGDLILIDGSTEMKMQEIIKEVKKI